MSGSANAQPLVNYSKFREVSLGETNWFKDCEMRLVALYNGLNTGLWIFVALFLIKIGFLTGFFSSRPFKQRATNSSQPSCFGEEDEEEPQCEIWVRGVGEQESLGAASQLL